MTTTKEQPVTPQRIMQFAWAYSVPLMIEAAIQHHVFDALDEGPKSLDELAKKTGASPRGLRAIANALVSFELLAKDAQGRYSLTPESATFLVTTKPKFQGGIFKHVSSQLIPKWLKLNDVVKTGQPATAVNKEEAAEFFEKLVEDIFPMSYGATQVLADHLKVAQANKPIKVLDIASGSGVWGIGLAQKSKQVRVSAVDWPRVLKVTQRIAAKHGVADQFSYIEGDMLEANFGTGYDIATLGHILHSDGEARSKRLLKRVFDALAPGGTIAIAEFLANSDRTGPPQAMIFAVNMIVNTEVGDTFSFEEISRWLKDAGFENPRQLEAPGPSPLILANKPK
jgi:ubiquinone/menaquinone biosynthesis C-methylase UbiE